MIKKEKSARLAKKTDGKKKTPAKRSKKSGSWNGEIVYVFKYVCVDCSLNPEVYDENDKKKVFDILKDLSKEIWIDKTYVDFKGTKFEKTFLWEEGWNALRNLVIDTKFGKKCTTVQRAAMDNAYRCIISGYLDTAFAELGWDTDNMKFEVADGTGFQVEYHKDITEEWKIYPGKWQTWK